MSERWQKAEMAKRSKLRAEEGTRRYTGQISAVFLRRVHRALDAFWERQGVPEPAQEFVPRFWQKEPE